MLSPRAIAVQGIGFSPRLVSVQGLWPFDIPVTPPDIGSSLIGGVGGGTGRRRPEIIKRQRDDDDLALVLVQALYACGFFSED